MSQPPTPQRKPGAGRPRLSPFGDLRKSKTFTVTEAEHAYLKAALKRFREMALLEANSNAQD